MNYKIQFGDNGRQTFTEREMGIVFWIMEREHESMYQKYTEEFGENVPPHDFELEDISDEEIDEVTDMLMAASSKDYSDFL